MVLLTLCAEFRGDAVSGSGPSRTLPLKTCVAVTERRHVFDARRFADAFARDLGMSIQDRGRVLIQVAEAATNLLNHAVGGEIFLSAVERGSQRAMEMIALDRGPGIEDLGRALAGGASSRGSLGEGLGAISRLADDFDVQTSPRGTVIFSRTLAGGSGKGRGGVLHETMASRKDVWSLGALCRARPGQTACGDAWAVCRDGEGTRLVVLADGLGHGPGAAEASEAMVRIVQKVAAQAGGRRPIPAAGEVLQMVHESLHGTRGAAVSVARVDDARGRLRFAGVGNVEGAVVQAQRRKGLVTHNGTAGSGTLKIQEFEQDWPPGALLLLHTDGIGDGWDLGGYAGLTRRDPAVVAGVLYRDGALQRDDASVLVLRRQQPPANSLLSLEDRAGGVP